MKKLFLALPMLAAALVLATGARAFTFENSGATSGGSSLADPDDQVKKSGSGSASTQQGSTGLHFGVGPASRSGLANPSNSPPAWIGNPLFLDKGSSNGQ